MGNSELTINLPASKSIVNRLLIIEKLSGQQILNKKDIACDDTKVLSQVLRLEKNVIDVKLSGTAMRFMAAFLAQKAGEWTLIGSEPLLLRPVCELVDALKTLGAEIYYLENEGFLPLKIIGKTLKSKPLEIANSKSSQTISALMLIAPYFENGLTINFQKISSFPYILLTKKIMEECGAKVQITDNQIIVSNKKYNIPRRVRKENSTQSPQKNHLCALCEKTLRPLRETSKIEADWSAAAFWYAFLSISDKRKITLNNLFSESYQSDSIVKNIFENFEIKSTFEKNNLIIEKENFTQSSQRKRRVRKKNIFANFAKKLCSLCVKPKPKVFEFNFENYPDLVPALAVTCCANDVKFVFSGVKNLKIKESNRLDALQNELKKCGFVLSQTENSLQWNSEKCPAEKCPKIETYHDHRIAMAFAMLSQKIDLQILNKNVVAKSYKNFWNDFNCIS